MKIVINETKLRKSIRSRLNEAASQQMDQEYLQAVQSGDMKKAEVMVRNAAKKAGYTIEAYHGTDWGGFTVFGASDYDRHMQDLQGIYFFSDSRTIAVDYADYYEGDKLIDGMTDQQAQELTFKDGVYHVFLQIKKPYKFNADGRNYQNINGDRFDFSKSRMSTVDLVTKIKKGNRYDGVIIYNVQDSATLCNSDSWATDIIVFNPNQIKLADTIVYDDQGEIIPLSQRFTNSSDIRYEEE